MSQEIETIRTVADSTIEVLCEQVYGYEPQVLRGDIVFAAEQEKVPGRPLADPAIPIIERFDKKSGLSLTYEGMQKWSRTVGSACSETEVNTDFLYTGTGIAILELANVVNYSASSSDPVVRLKKVASAFNKDTSAHDVCSFLSDQTGIDVNRIVSGLDQDDFNIISRLRYGIGVVLKASGFGRNDVKDFAQHNLQEAAISINKYKHGIAGYLSGAVDVDAHLGDTSDAEVAAAVYQVEFPYLEIASSMPMNVGMLLNK